MMDMSRHMGGHGWLPMWLVVLVVGVGLFSLTFDSSAVKGEGIWLFFVSSSHVCMLSFCMVYVRSI